MAEESDPEQKAAECRGATRRSGSLWVASRGLIAANILVPTGFLLGDFDIHRGDPSLATPIFVLLSGALLLIGVVVVAPAVNPPATADPQLPGAMP